MHRDTFYFYAYQIYICSFFFLEQNQSLSLIQRLALISTELSGEDLTDICPMTGVKRQQIIEEVPPPVNKWKPQQG